MKKFLIVPIVLILLLTACGGAAPVLTDGMKASMNARADAYDLQFPDNADINVARICVDAPIALYWNSEIQTYAVACNMPSLPNVYGIVLLDVNNVVLNTEHINAVSLAGLEDLIRGLGWERVQ